jgi:hypothetical protein
MTELVAIALTMVDSPTEDVRSAIVDYQDRRQQLLPDECEAYEVVTDDSGVGTEVAMTLALHQVIRNRKGGRRKNKRTKGKQEPLHCVFRLEELSDERIVERDTRSSLCTTWTLRSTEDDRTAVHVRVSWDGPDGIGNFLRRQNEQLAMRMLYEDILTRLHESFLVDESAAEDAGIEEPGSSEPGSAEPGAAEPSRAESGSAEPSRAEPGSAGPGAAEPTAEAPAEPEAPTEETDSSASPASADEPPVNRGGTSSGQS